MKRSSLYDAVLFSVEKGAYPYKYRLYFAIAGQKGEEPELHRFFVRSKKIFDGFKLGGTYNIDYSGIRINSAQLTDIYPLTDSEYYELIRLRDLQFMDAKTQAQLNMDKQSYTPSEIYYSFKIFKSLAEYKPGAIKAFLINLCKLACYLLSFFIPIALYLLAIYFFSASSRFSSSGHLALTVPTASVCLLPFIIWMMCALNNFVTLLLLNIPYMRSYLLKSYTLRWAGMRKSCYIDDSSRRALLKGGLITFGIAAASIIVSLIL